MAKLKQRSGKQKVLKQKKKFEERLVTGKSKVTMKKQLKKKEDQSHESDFEIMVENANSKIQIEVMLFVAMVITKHFKCFEYPTKYGD